MVADPLPLPCISDDDLAQTLAREVTGLARRLLGALEGPGCNQFDLGNLGQDLCDACDDLARRLQSLADDQALEEHLETRLAAEGLLPALRLAS